MLWAQEGCTLLWNRGESLPWPEWLMARGWVSGRRNLLFQAGVSLLGA